MVHAGLHKNNKKDEEVDIRVVTQGGAKIGKKIEHGESSGQKLEGNIRKESQPPPKFNASQQNNSMCDAQNEIEEEWVCEEL